MSTNSGMMTRIGDVDTSKIVVARVFSAAGRPRVRMNPTNPPIIMREADVELQEHEAEEDARADDRAGPQRKGAHGCLSLSMARSSRTT